MQTRFSGIKLTWKISFAILLSHSIQANAVYAVMDDDLMPTEVVETRLPSVHYTIPFAKGNSPLTSSGRSALDIIIPQMHGQSVRIVGRPDAILRNGKLAQLASNRSNVIRNYLLQEGIPADDIIVEIDNSPNPQQNGNIYPSDIYVTRTQISRQTLPLAPVLPTQQTTKSTAQQIQRVSPLTAADKTAIYIGVPEGYKVVPIQSDVSTKNKTTETTAQVQTVQKTITQPAVVAESVQKISPKVEGVFNVVKKDVADKAQSSMPAITAPTSYDLPIGATLDAESRSAIARLAGSAKEVAVIADGSIAGYKKAKEISSYIGEITGTRPEIRTKGAAKGLVTVKG